ncbi:MAG: neutral/alkaline non-lysosomal ceramidase N-terminal domain-containing protein [Verrucomicrobiales bacterium]|nr:neutral/alkaline non-lysosomal ceramidase N-terminal domain-containing protein [Verrucomicrobiales bacterium]
MNSIRSVSLLSALLVSFTLFQGTSHADQLEAGAAIVEITPQEWPVVTRGSFNPKPKESAHDPLHARALAFRNGAGKAVICVADVIITEPASGTIRQAAAAATGWPVENILLAGTHTHSAPAPYGEASAPAEVAFRKRAADGIVEAISKAIKNLEPARVGFGSDKVPDEVFNRRWYLEEGTMPVNPFGGYDTVKMNPNRSHITKPAGPTDPEVAVVSVQTARGRPLALLGNYSLHYVGAVPGAQVSADYFGEFAKIVPFRIAGRTPPEKFVGILSNGTSGDINNIDFTGKRAPRAPFEQIQIVAGKVADAAWRATREIDYAKDAPVKMTQRSVTLKYRKPDENLIEQSRAILKMSPDEMKEAKLSKLAGHYALRTLSAADQPDTVDVTIQALRIGDQAIVSLPFETLVEIGLELKEKSPFPHTFTIELANGAFGYLPTPGQHKLGGYETWLGTCKVQHDASRILTDELLEMLAELKK